MTLGPLGPAERRYLNLLRDCLTRALFPEKYTTLRRPANIRGLGKLYRPIFWDLLLPAARKVLGGIGLDIVRRAQQDPGMRNEGRDWPADAETMVGTKRLDSLLECIDDVLRHDVPGDFIETGVWRGGASIFMRAALGVYGDTERSVWLADSFEGLPKASGDYAEDTGSWYWEYNHVLAVSLDDVKRNFARYGWLDDRVKFLKGWFKDTMPTAPVTTLAILRLDGDMYESTIDVLNAMYPKLSVGGYCIIDDYALDECRKAVADYREAHGITEEIRTIDWTGAVWRKERPGR